MLTRLTRAALALSAVGALAAGTLAVPSAVTAAPAKTTTVGSSGDLAVFGSAVITYDGVYRQSLAILGLRATGARVPASTVRWLLAQQCANGAFSAHSPTPGTCAPYDPVKYTGGNDSNATATAVLALRSVGQTAAADRAAAWLRGVQNADGGWEFTPGTGSGSDPNSTGLAMLAARPTGAAKDAAVAYLAGLQVGRTIEALEPGDAGGISTQWSGGAPDHSATVQAVPGLLGRLDLTSLGANGALDAMGDWQAAPRVHDATPPATGEGVGGWAASWLAAQDGTSVPLTQAAWTVLSLASDRTGRDAAKSVYAALRAARATYSTDPGALGQAALAARVLGENADADEYARLLIASLAAQPRPTLAAPKAKTKPKAARILTGTTRPGAYPVTEVCVRAAQKRPITKKATRTRWFSYTSSATGTGTWKKRKSRAVALRTSSLVCVAPTGTTWSSPLAGTTRGRLVVRWTATDQGGARSVTKQRVVTVGKTKQKAKR